MNNLEKIKQNISSNVETRLSMRYSFVLMGVFLTALLVGLFIFSLPYLNGEKKYDQDLIYGLLFFIVSFSFLIFVFKNISKLYLIGKNLRIVKFFGTEETININQIEKVKSIRFKNTRYNWITYQNNFNVKQNILVFTTESLLWGNQSPIKEVIEMVKSM